jgi:biopolymer transport protein ExbB
MFLAADIVVQGVMGGLMLSSVAAWSIWFAKLLELASMKRRLNRGNAALLAAQTLNSVGDFSSRGDDWIARALRAAREEIDPPQGSAVAGVKERVASRLMDIERNAVRTMRTGTGILASIGSTAPFVGLFGTVWGIMNSFIGISRSQTTNLAVVAPGIAEALLATALGLVAAIPAVLFYNHLMRATAANKSLFADSIARIERLVSRELDEQSVPQSRLKLASE